MLSLISPILVDISYCSHTSKCAIAFSNAESVLDSVHVTVCTQRKHLRMYGSQCAADSKKKKKILTTQTKLYRLLDIVSLQTQ